MVKQENLKPTEWHGLKPGAFRPYRQWINKENPGICGTYVSSALLHYLYRTQYGEEISKDSLIEGLRFQIEKALPYKGTFPWDLKRGLNMALKKVPEWHAKMGFIPDVHVVKELSKENPLPVAVGTTAVLGSPYKNHWILVYAYGRNKEGKLFFKGYDNHGWHTAVVPASQTFGCVWLSRNRPEK